MTFRRIVYMWTGYWNFDAAYFERRAPRSAQRFRQHDPFLLGFWGLRSVEQHDRSLAIRFAIVLFFPLTYYFSHPETYYFRPVDPLIVVLAAVAVAGRQKQSVDA